MATDDAKSIREVVSLFTKYDMAKMRLRSTKHIKRGADHAHTETLNNGIEKTIANVPARVKGGKDDRYLKVSSPPRYTINP